MPELTDECLMPVGVHKGKEMQDVPASYLMWYYHEAKFKRDDIVGYIKDNLQVLEKELKG